MKKYNVIVQPSALIITVEAENEDSAIEQAENEFLQELSRGIFDIDYSHIKEDQEKE